MGKIMLSSLLVLTYLLGFIGCAKALPKFAAKMPSKSAFQNVKYGSSYDEVEKELGQNGSLVSESQNEIFTRKIYRWGDGKTPCRVYLTFRNGKLTFKKYSGICD